MIISTLDTARPFENSPVCKGVSYEASDETLDGALITVRGRYPDSGFLMNEVSKELVYITAGQGEVLSTKQSRRFSLGDVIFITAGEEFAWRGNFEGFFATTPRFDHLQHKEIAQ